MGAVFYKLSNNNIFKAGGGGGQIVHSNALFSGLLGEASQLTLLVRMSIQCNENIQFFQSFDDVIHHYYFGKGVGQISMDLLCFLECGNTSAPGLHTLWGALGKVRGKEIDVAFDGIVVSGVLMDFTINAVSEPETHYIICINLGMTKNGLPSVSIPGAC